MRKIIEIRTAVSDLIFEIEKNKQTSGIYWYCGKRVQIKLL